MASHRHSLLDLALHRCNRPVFAALAVSRLVEARTGWSIKKFVRAARRYRTITIRAGTQTLLAEDPPPSELRDAFEQIV